MKIIQLLVFLLLISFESHAVDIYKCKIDKRTSVAGCGFFKICKHPKTNSRYTDPFVISEKVEGNYTILTFPQKLIIKQVWDGYEHVIEKQKNSSNFKISNDRIEIFQKWQSFLLFKNHFYFEMQSRPYKIIYSGTCKKE